MNIGFFTSTTEIKEYPEERLNSGWVRFQGPIGIIEILEDAVHTPRIGKNADFEIIGFVAPKTRF